MLDCIPRKAALCSPHPTSLEVLIRIDPDRLPKLEEFTRPPLNLALVLDRSGSMDGEKWMLTQAAACQAIQNLTADDFLTVVAFDKRIDCIFTGPVQEPAAICQLVCEIKPDGATNLFGGWKRGADELRNALDPARLSRLVLLTDGEANEGEIDVTKICVAVSRHANMGLQTTTLGFGEGYNERLLREMARSGLGNHAYIEPQRMSAIFKEEMDSLLRARGTGLRLRLVPAAGVRMKWLADSWFDGEGRVMLADLVEDKPLALVVGLEFDGAPPPAEQLKVELSWRNLATGRTELVHSQLNLPVVARRAWDVLPSHPEVELHLAQALSQRYQGRAMYLLDLDQEDIALQFLGWAADLPHLPPDEIAVINDLIATVERGDHNASRKKAAMYSHGHGSGHAQVSRHYAEPVATQEKKPRGKLPLGCGALFRGMLEGPGPTRARKLGMLRGHFYGERLVRGARAPRGEGAELTLATLKYLRTSPFNPQDLGRGLSRVPLLHTTTSQQKFRLQMQNTETPLLEMGSPSAGCAALRRLCPFLLVSGDNLFVDTALATVITHRDNLALTCSLGYMALLWELLLVPMTPPAEFYAETFLEAIEELEDGTAYECQSGFMKGWKGALKDFIPLALGRARQEGWSATKALKAWGSGPYLLEVVPSLLYILEKHADDPNRALQVATTDTYEADTLGMLVGAAVGAIHGGQAGWFLDDELEKDLELLR